MHGFCPAHREEESEMPYVTVGEENSAKLIIGARKLAQLQDNLASFELTLSPDQVKSLDEASSIELGFPYDLYGKELPRTFMYGGMGDRILT
jgi:hypothetical protein